MAVLRSGVHAEGGADDFGDSTVTPGAAAGSAWNVAGSFTFVPPASFSIRAGVHAEDGMDDWGDETITPGAADGSDWNVAGDFVFMGEFPTNKPCPDSDVWGVVLG